MLSLFVYCFIHSIELEAIHTGGTVANSSVSSVCNEFIVNGDFEYSDTNHDSPFGWKFLEPVSTLVKNELFQDRIGASYNMKYAELQRTAIQQVVVLPEKLVGYSLTLSFQVGSRQEIKGSALVKVSIDGKVVKAVPVTKRFQVHSFQTIPTESTLVIQFADASVNDNSIVLGAVSLRGCVPQSNPTWNQTTSSIVSSGMVAINRVNAQLP